MGVSLLDAFIVLILLAGLVRGFAVGALRQVASFVGLLAALLVAGQLMHSVGALLVKSLGLSDEVAPLVGFAVLFVGIWLLFVALSRLLEQLLDTLSLTPLNRVAGSLVGAFKAALLLSLLFLFLQEIEVPREDVRDRSVLYGPVAEALPTALEAAADYWPAAKRMSNAFGEEVRPQIRSSVRPN